jgi:dihydrofolate reductase
LTRVQEASKTMRTVIYSMLVSLDGYIAGPNGEIAGHGVDEEFHTFANDLQHRIDTYLFGRRMYEVMSYWDTVGDDPNVEEVEREFAHLWSQKLKIVFSSTLESINGNARFAESDLEEEIARLRSQPGRDIAIGGATLAASAIERDLVDEFWLFVQPVLVGGGTPYFPSLNRPLQLQLAETRSFGSGVVYLRYTRAHDD